MSEFSLKTTVYGAQYKPWTMDNGQAGVSAFLFIHAEADANQGIVGTVPSPVKCDEALAKQLVEMRPTPFPCLCEVTQKLVAGRKGITAVYTKCVPVSK